MSKTFIREKKTYCGKDYLEVDIYSLTDEQVKKAKMEYESYEKFIVHIFAQDKQDAHRLIGGFHPWKYKEWFEYHYNYSLTYKIKTLTKKLNRKVKQISVRHSN